eukprot:359232-Chlamydomonas_euryale.AAC.4
MAVRTSSSSTNKHRPVWRPACVRSALLNFSRRDERNLVRARAETADPSRRDARERHTPEVCLPFPDRSPLLRRGLKVCCSACGSKLQSCHAAHSAHASFGVTSGATAHPTSPCGLWCSFWCNVNPYCLANTRAVQAQASAAETGRLARCCATTCRGLSQRPAWLQIWGPGSCRSDHLAGADPAAWQALIY